ncbi:MAG: DUF7718 family protein [Terriglobales bacterium]
MQATTKQLSFRANRFLSYVQKKLGLSRIETQRPESRTRYIVQPGETLESIASESFGDTRFSDLIVTVNRAKVAIDDEGRATVESGQILDLPAPREARIYKANVLTTVRGGCVATVHKPRLLDVPSVDRTVPTVSDDLIDELSEVCRLFCSVRGSHGSQFSVKLQTSILGSFVTIAAYDSMHGRASRTVYGRDGTSLQMQLDLPNHVVYDMAKRDFRRNWQRYYDLYFSTELQVNIR